MLVYGDRRREIATRQALASGDFFRTAELAQGLVDAEFASRGEDDLTPLHAAAMADLRALAAGREPVALASRLLPARVVAKEPEGYAFYAVYPEAYAEAARALPWPAPPFVIGLRSIGLGLAAVVAEATGATDASSVRPAGPPFRRELRLSQALKARVEAHRGPFVVVDEGPGLSGSSFGAVLALFEGLNVEPERIVVMPSHHGAPGPEASPDIRRRWSQVRRVVAQSERWTSGPKIRALFEDLTGAVDDAEDLSGGAWRAGRDVPTFPQQERLKFRLSGASGSWLARFAGLGEAGAAKFELARALHAAGAGPEPIALRDGFLLSRWISGAPACPTLDELTGYLRLRAALAIEPGASLEELAEMVRVNAAELGMDIIAHPPDVASRPVAVDGRLHVWEWLRTRDGRLVKTDALDHHRAHDLIGGQDIAWDVAGAAVEFGLDEHVLRDLAHAVRADPRLVAFHRLAYPAFQAGLWSFAGNRAQVARYRTALETVAGLDRLSDERSRS